MEKKKTLTSAQIADAERLKALYEAKHMGRNSILLSDELHIA